MSLRPTATESSHPISAWLLQRSFLDVGAGVVELLDIGRGEAQPRGRDEVAELVQPRGARNGGRDAGARHQPCQSDLGRGDTMMERHLIERRKDPIARLLRYFPMFRPRALFPKSASERYLPVRKPLARP